MQISPKTNDETDSSSSTNPESSSTGILDTKEEDSSVERDKHDSSLKGVRSGRIEKPTKPTNIVNKILPLIQSSDSEHREKVPEESQSDIEPLSESNEVEKMDTEEQEEKSISESDSVTVENKIKDREKLPYKLFSDDEKKDCLVAVRNIDKGCTESEIKEVFKDFNCVRIMVRRHTTVLHLKDEKSKRQILAHNFTLNGKNLVCEDMSRVYISNIPTDIKLEQIKEQIEDVFQEANVKVKRTTCDNEGYHCGHIKVSANIELLEELVKKPEYKVWDRQLIILQYAEFHKRFTLMLFGLTWRIFQMHGMEHVLRKSLEETGCTGKIIFLCWNHPEIVFEKEEDLEKALLINDTCINGTRVFVRRYKQTPHFVTIFNIPQSTTEDQFRDHFKDIDIMKIRVYRKTWKLELKDEIDLVKCLRLHQTMLNGSLIKVRIWAQRPIEDFFPSLLRYPYYYRNFDFVKDKLTGLCSEGNKILGPS